MALTAYRGSTQDSTAGVQVSQSINESGLNSGTLVAGVQVGNKSTYANIARTGITAQDVYAGGDVTLTGFAISGLLDLENALNVFSFANCNTASANMSGRYMFYNVASGCQGTSPVISFASDPTLRLGNAAGDFICPVILTDVGSARFTKFFIDSVSAGIWSVTSRPI